MAETSSAMPVSSAFTNFSNTVFRNDENTHMPMAQFQQLPYSNIIGQGRVNQLGGVFINGRPLPLYIRQKIVEMAKKGIKPCQISRELRVSHGCVSKILYRYAETGSIEPGQHSGQKPYARPRPAKVAPHIRRNVALISKMMPKLRSDQIQDVLVAQGLCTRQSVPTGVQIMEILESERDKSTPSPMTEDSKSAMTALKHSVDDILQNGNANSSNDSNSKSDNSPAFEAVPEHRRVRTSFTAEQLTVLEQLFACNNYPDAKQRQIIAARTGLCDSRIQVWFSNRRARSRKTFVFNTPPSTAPVLTMPSIPPITLPPLLMPNFQTSRGSISTESSPSTSEFPPLSMFPSLFNSCGGITTSPSFAQAFLQLHLASLTKAPALNATT
uniref:Paired domain-containing protein n=1 Tax=Panagrellus redivivus TaxID=6233 RepID=A0A7E4V5A4_PANRE